MSANAVDLSTPTGAAGGSLSGTYPNPGVAVPLNQRAAAANPLFGAGTTGDTNNRVELDADGGIRLGPGNAAVDTAITRNGVNSIQVPAITAGALATLTAGAQVTNGFVDVATVGRGFAAAEGANAKQGTFPLSGAATTTVANTSVTANSRIFLQTQALGTVTVASTLAVSSRVAGTSFTVTPSQATDTSTIAFEIFEPG